MKTKEERANDKTPKIVEIYLAIEISIHPKKCQRKKKGCQKA
jgi:hypothetical protein